MNAMKARNSYILHIWTKKSRREEINFAVPGSRFIYTYI
jgi:hypothetical protein